VPSLCEDSNLGLHPAPLVDKLLFANLVVSILSTWTRQATSNLRLFISSGWQQVLFMYTYLTFDVYCYRLMQISNLEMTPICFSIFKFKIIWFSGMPVTYSYMAKFKIKPFEGGSNPQKLKKRQLNALQFCVKFLITQKNFRIS